MRKKPRNKMAANGHFLPHGARTETRRLNTDGHCSSLEKYTPGYLAYALRLLIDPTHAIPVFTNVFARMDR